MSPQRGLISAELLERNRRFRQKLLKFVRAAHQLFLGTLVPALKIDDNKLTRLVVLQTVNNPILS